LQHIKSNGLGPKQAVFGCPDSRKLERTEKLLLITSIID